jgi:hypothetical protein
MFVLSEQAKKSLQILAKEFERQIAEAYNSEADLVNDFALSAGLPDYLWIIFVTYRDIELVVRWRNKLT